MGQSVDAQRKKIELYFHLRVKVDNNVIFFEQEDAVLIDSCFWVDVLRPDSRLRFRFVLLISKSITCPRCDASFVLIVATTRKEILLPFFFVPSMVHPHSTGPNCEDRLQAAGIDVQKNHILMRAAAHLHSLRTHYVLAVNSSSLSLTRACRQA
jgi:hypothetical protein